MRLDTSGCHLSTKWMDFSVFQAPSPPSPPSPFGAQEFAGIHLDAHLINPLLPLLISKNQTYELQVGSFKCSFEEVLELTCDSQPKRGGGQTQGSLRNPLVVQCFENNWLQSTEGLLALGSSYWVIYISWFIIFNYFQTKAKPLAGKFLLAQKNLSLAASQNCREKHNSPHWDAWAIFV